MSQIESSFMKHIKLFEAAENKLDASYYYKLEKDLAKLFNNIKSYYNYLIDFLEENVELDDTVWSYVDSDGHWTANFNFIDKDNGDIVSNSDSIFSFDDMTTQSQYDIINLLLPYVHSSYKYQKIIIDKHPDLIPEIIDILHPKIKEEYKHLGNAKDLNLI